MLLSSYLSWAQKVNVHDRAELSLPSFLGVVVVHLSSRGRRLGGLHPTIDPWCRGP